MADKPQVRVKPRDYQPSKAELEADTRIDTTPEALRAAVMRTVTLEETKDA